MIRYGKVCLEGNICKKLGSAGFSDEVTLVLGVGDIISSLAIGIPPFTLSALLVKSGPKSFCHCGTQINKARKNRLLSAAKKLELAL